MLLLQRQEAGEQLRGGCLQQALRCSGWEAKEQLSGQVLRCSGWRSRGRLPGRCYTAAARGLRGLRGLTQQKNLMGPLGQAAVAHAAA